MKKGLYLIAAALMFAACAKEETEVIVPSHNVEGKTITIGASFELPTSGTKSDIDDNGNFTWSTGDAIWIGSDETSATSNWGKLDIQKGTGEIGPGYKSASFEGTMFGSTTAIASVFPATVQPSYAASTGKLSLTLPTTIAWNDSDNDNNAETMQADNVLVARYVDIYSGGYSRGTTTGLHFLNVGGLFRLTLKNIPVGASKLVFTTDKKINGTFAVKDTVENSVNYPVINTEDTAKESEKSVEITFTTITEGTNKRVFFIPVPVGSYQIGFAVKDAEDNDLWAFSTSKTNSVARGHMVKMPTLSHVVVSGDGDGATNIIVTPTSFSGNVYLPSTENDVYVKMNETDGTINLEYSQTGNLKPANVYLQALGDITALNINLPETHVQLTGEENIHTLTKVSANTSVSTFVVDNLVKIGKDDVATSGLTITGGSLDLSADVAGTVTIAIPEGTVNETEERVSISIGSAINNLVVTHAATQDAPDKIYVSLGAESSVTETISVPETNCNLYVAKGAQVKIVNTQAAENTIEGEVETLSASGSGTTVTVTEKADVTKSISATQGATVIVDNNALKDENDNAYNTTQTKDASSTISTVDGLVATIGSAGYSSLDNAVAAAVDGATITIIKAGTYTIPVINKNLTIVGGLDGVKVEHTGKNPIATIGSTKTATFKNIAFTLGTDYNVGFGTASTVATSGALVMEDCTIDGTLTLFGASTFTNCEFTANGSYNVWGVYSNATFTGCSFTNTNRAVNVYDGKTSDTRKTVSFSGCTFTASEKKKAAINIHHNPSPVKDNGAHYDVVITNCTTSGTWAESVAETGEPADATVCNNALWMVSDIVNWANGDITVTVDGAAQDVYEVPVAQIGSTTYATLAEAFAAVGSGQTITLQQNVTLADNPFVVSLGEKNVTLDLGGKTLTGRTNLTSGNLTLQNGSVTFNGHQPLNVYGSAVPGTQNYSVLTVANNVTVTGNYGVCLFGATATTNGYGAVVNMAGTFNAKNGIFVSGNLGNNVADDMHNIVNITGTLTSSDVAVALNGWATVNVKSGANITGATGIGVKRGALNVEDGATVKGNGEWVAPPSANNSGTESSGAAVSMTNTYNNYGAMSVNISGGTFTSVNGQALYKANQTYNNDATFSVTGGTFNTDPSAYVADGYEAVDNGNGTWTVKEFQGVAQIGSSYYKTLDEAIAAAKAGDIITVINDTEVSNGNIYINNSITLDLNGKIIYNLAENCRLFRVANGATLTIDGTTTGSAMVIPESNKRSYGFVNLDSASKENALVINGGSYSGAMLNGAFFKALGTYQTVTIENATVTVEDGDGVQYGSAATNINGIGKVFDSSNMSILNISNSELICNTTKAVSNTAQVVVMTEKAIVDFNNVHITTVMYGGFAPCYGTVSNTKVSHPNGQSLSWANTALEIAHGGYSQYFGKSIINSGYYEGQYAINVLTSGAEAEINGGTFLGETAAIHIYGNSGYPDSPFDITITGGEFRGTGTTPVAIQTLANPNTDLKISGGTFIGDIIAADASQITITGGTFDHDPSAYVADGYEAVQSNSVWTVEVKAAQAKWIDNAASSYESVDETNKIITISTAAQLAKLAKDIQDNDANPSTFAYMGWTFKLTSDIDLSGKIWTPIGADLTNYYHASFRGTFDGNGHKITNMHAVASEWSGLFGPLHSGMDVIIKDLTIEDFVVESNHYAGAIAGWIEQAGKSVTISNCVVTQGTITSTPELIGTGYDNGDKVGGICGYVHKATSAVPDVCITGNTVSNVNITAYRDLGGLLGYAKNMTQVFNNTIQDVNLYENFTHNYKNYNDYTSCDCNSIVGELNSSTLGENTVTNVKMYTNATGSYTEIQQ